ncbi:glycosyltransferase [Bacillaceae bacterium S4-13-56]
MLSSPKVLILTGSYGNGHLQVTRTLSETFKRKGINNIVVSDLFLEAHPTLTSITKSFYIMSYTYGQRLYGLFYYGGNKQSILSKTAFIHKLGMQKLEEIVENEKPDIIVNTFPMLVVPEFRKKKGVTIPIFNILTDFCAHKNWIHEEIDRYYVATEELKQDIMNSNVPLSNIRVTGIPIQPQFEEDLEKQEILHKYDLKKDSEVILIIAGAFGVLKDMEEIVAKLSKEHRYQVVVVCGKNEKLRKKLTNRFLNTPRIKILGYSNHLYELMSVASIMVTKPGGITLSEALAIKTPLVLYRSVPGQELENACYFERKGAAFLVNDPTALIEKITQITRDSHLQNEMKLNMKKIHNPNAASVICTDILQFLEKNPGDHLLEGGSLEYDSISEWG